LCTDEAKGRRSDSQQDQGKICSATTPILAKGHRRTQKTPKETKKEVIGSNSFAVGVLLPLNLKITCRFGGQLTKQWSVVIRR
jgi:hypothetical protein